LQSKEGQIGEIGFQAWLRAMKTDREGAGNVLR